MHGLDCRELELVGQVHALLLQLAAGFADALRDLRAQALILLVAPAVPDQGRRARVVERGRGTITGSLHGSRRGVDDRTGMRQRVLWRCGTCERSCDPGHEPTVFRLAKEANNVKGGRRNSST